MFYLWSLALLTLAAAAAVPAGVPDYVTKYAPMVYLYSEEAYFPSDLGAQLQHTQPEVNFSGVQGGPNPLTLNNLADLNQFGGEKVYLTATGNIEDNPPWLLGVVPDANGETTGAVSCAIIVNDHGGGLVDVFYMYFYAFNWGGKYLDYFIIGDHVGDWEHNMIRFQDGQPQAVWFSQHAYGEAFYYFALEKYQGGPRWIDYSANGTHANYAIGGTHDHSIPDFNLPFGFVEDFTDNGALWDPTLSAYYVQYDAATQAFTPYDNSTPTNWLSFLGEWGDQQYPDSDPRQQDPFDIPGLYKYGDGPTGPIDKNLNRSEVCPPSNYLCILRPLLGP